MERRNIKLKTRIKNKFMAVIMLFALLFNTIIPVTSVFAEGTPKEVTASVTNLTIQNLSGQTVEKVYWSDSFYLAMDWDATANGAELHEGDYFDITLPDKMVFPSDSSSVDFNIYGTDGVTVIGKAHVTPGVSDKGGTVRITFTDWVVGKENVKGNIRLSSRFDKNQVTTGEENSFSISVGGRVVPVNIIITGPKELDHEILAKWGQSVSDNKEQAEWWVRINHQKSALSNVIISDHLTEGTDSETYIADSFRLTRVEMDSYGNTTEVYETIDLTGKLNISGDGKSFTVNLGNVIGQQYRLSYRTTYTPRTTLRNNITLNSTEQSKTISSTHISANSGGSGDGTLANKIKLTKVDADDNSITLPDAVFEVTRPDGSTFELTTGADGTVTSGTLSSGTYKVKERHPPFGYELNDKEYILTVNSSGGALQTIKDEPIKTSVSVEKKWIGSSKDAVMVHLYADDRDTGSSVSLDDLNNWKHTFDNLRKYNKDGTEIKYTVKEDVPVGYENTITGSQESGYIIINTNTEKLTIPVVKQWIGKKADSVTLKLFADNRDTGKTIILNEAGHWKGSFTDILKYDMKDGHEIAYTVKEEKVEGYTSTVTGDNKKGFVITNIQYTIPSYNYKQNNTPQTGDFSNSGLYIGLFVLSGVIPVIIGFKRKKDNKVK